jgi:hypothetical protein
VVAVWITPVVRSYVHWRSDALQLAVSKSWLYSPLGAKHCEHVVYEYVVYEYIVYECVYS